MKTNDAPMPADLAMPEQQHAEFLAQFTCSDLSGKAAPCAHAPQRWGPEYHPRVALPDGSIAICPLWLPNQCARYHEKRDQWIEIGRDRGIPTRFLEASINSPRRTPALDVVTIFIREAARRGRALTLLGPPGVGKTWAASAAVHAWPDPRGPVGDPMYLQVSGFIRDLLRWDRADRRQHPLDEAIQSSFVALDDIGVGYLKSEGYAAMALEELLHERHGAQLPTIITSNWMGKELSRRLSRRTYDRLREWGDVVELSGPSLREAD